MTVNTPHVGVRTFLQDLDQQPLIIADMSTIGGCFTAPQADRSLIPPDEPIHFTTDDAEMVAAVGATGTLAETIDACNREGVIASIVAMVPEVDPEDDIEDQMAAICGSSTSKTGLWGLLEAEAQTGVAPDFLLTPGFSSQRLDSAANPAATIIDALCTRMITAIGLCDVPSTSKEAAVEWTADFAETMNLVAIGQQVRYQSGSTIVTRAASAAVAALMVKNDKARGAPYYNPGNKPLIGILGPDRAVSFRPDDPDCEANYLIQRGVNSLVQLTKNRTSRKTNSPQGKTFWGYFNTSSDPLWRSISVVRTRKAVREVIPRTLIKYMGRNLGVHLVTTLLESLDDFISELQSLPEPAVLPGSKVKWERALNSNANMRTGGLNISLAFEEAPTLTDLGIYMSRHEASFDILAADIEASMQRYNVRGSLNVAA